MRRVAERVASGATAVVVTHDLDLVAEYATRVVALADGRVVFDGHPAELLADDVLLAACALRRPPERSSPWPIHSGIRRSPGCHTAQDPHR